MNTDHRAHRPTATGQVLPLAQAFAASGLTVDELYWKHLGFGGTVSPGDLEAVLFGDLDPGPQDHTVLAQVVNEALMDAGRPERAAFTWW